jgi:hypothetical protein
MLWFWTASLPLTVLNTPNVTQYPQQSFGTGRDIAGVILYDVGLTTESISNSQKYLLRGGRVTSLSPVIKDSPTGPSTPIILER